MVTRFQISRGTRKLKFGTREMRQTKDKGE